MEIHLENPLDILCNKKTYNKTAFAIFTSLSQVYCACVRYDFPQSHYVTGTRTVSACLKRATFTWMHLGLNRLIYTSL